jgi:hypothetical protein
MPRIEPSGRRVRGPPRRAREIAESANAARAVRGTHDAPSGVKVDRPLGQIVLVLLVAGTGVQRAVVAATALSGAGLSLGSLALGLESAAFLGAAICLWIGGRAAFGGAIAFGVCLVASGVAIGVAGGEPAVPNAVGRVFFGVAAAAGLAFVVRTELTQNVKGTPE